MSYRLVRFVNAAALVVALTAVPSAMPQVVAADDPIPPRAQVTKNPKLDSKLVAASVAARERGAAAGLNSARDQALSVVGDRVRVVVESSAAFGRNMLRTAVLALRGEIEGEYADLLQVRLPLASLELMASRTDVRYVRPPLLHATQAVAGQGVGATNASVWHSAGLTGAGVKIAVIDVGFAGYLDRQASGDLPASVTIGNFCGDGFGSPQNHGTAVAEIVHETSPGAELHLYCVNSEVTLGQAKDYAKANGISIVNHSVGWFNSSRGDGSGGPGTPDAIVADARANGILWVNAAGNHAQKHWTGTFQDFNGDGFHDFTTTDSGNTFIIGANAAICATLKWDDWPASAQDYDLYLARSSDGVALGYPGINAQTGTQQPTEAVCYQNGPSQLTAFLGIDRYAATATPRFDLFVLGWTSSLQYVTVAGSIVEPATSPSALAAGAICWQTDALETYSSRGPTISGVIKPDIAGQDSVSSATYGTFTTCGASGFSGTSAAAPHTAAAAAIVKQANPTFGPAQLQSFLEGAALDLGSAGKDSSYGSGKLWLGTTPTLLADVAITVTDVPDPAFQGANLLYTAIVQNNGPLTATGVVFTDPLPANVDFVLAHVNSMANTCSGTTAISCQIGTLASGATATVRVIIQPNVQGALSNTVSVSSGGGDTNLSNNSATTVTTVRAPLTELVITQTDSPDPVSLRGNLTYAFQVTNYGPSRSSGVSFSDPLPAGVSLISTSTSRGTCSGTNEITCAIGGIDPFEVIAISVTVRPTVEGPLTNTATVSGNETESSGTNNAATVSTTVGPASADLSLTKTDNFDPVTLDGRLTYTITVQNAGPSAVTGFTVSDPLPAGTSLVSATPPNGGSCSGTSTVSCTLGALDIGGSATVSVVVVAPGIQTALSNTATATSSDPDPNTANNSATQATTTSAFADVLPSDWAYASIASLLSRGITTGCYFDATTGERRYCANDSVTRAQMAAFLVRAVGSTPYANPTATFSDVPSSYWAYGWIERLYQLGITTGCYYDGVERRYCPESLVPRDQMAVFLMRAKTLTELASPTPTFSDVPSTHWAYGWIERLYERAVTTGCYDDGVERRYCPTSNVTRREMAAFIVRTWP